MKPEPRTKAGRSEISRRAIRDLIKALLNKHFGEPEEPKK